MFHYFRYFLSFMVISMTISLTTLNGAKTPSSQEFLVLNETLYSGFGAELSAVLGGLYAFESGQYSGVEVNLSSGLFFDQNVGPNWWEYYFSPVCFGKKGAYPTHYSTVQDCCQLSQMAYNLLSRKQNHALIKKYIHVRHELQVSVDMFVQEQFNGHFVIGVHHRGTDKVTEVPLIPWDLTMRVLQHTIEHLPAKLQQKFMIYVATDDQNFLDHVRMHYPSHVISGDFHRSTGGQPLHSYESNHYSSNYEKGREALCEALILSRCHALIRPASSGYSWMSTVFNPTMPVNSINCANWKYPGNWVPALPKR